MARNGSGVRPASKSSIEISFMFEGERCRERVSLPPTPHNLKRAELHKAQIELSILNDSFNYAATFPNSKRAKAIAKIPTGSMLLSSYLDMWLERKSKELHSSTISGYAKIIKRLQAGLGHIPLKSLTRGEVRDWISQFNVSNKTFGNMISPLNTALDDAVMDGILEVNPVAGFKWKNRKQQKKKHETDPFDKEEQLKIMSAKAGQDTNLYTFLLWTGLRPSEAAALNWSDIDMNNGTVDVNKGFTHAAEESEATKTGAGNRVLKLLPPALDAVRKQMAHTGEKSQEVFQHPKWRERWQGDQAIRKRWVLFLKRNDIRYRKPYQLRHTFASMMISSGENVRWLSSYLGHSDLMTTLRIYAHWLSDADPNAGMKAFEKFGL